jgi:hypothetical protein
MIDHALIGWITRIRNNQINQRNPLKIGIILIYTL